MKTTAFGLVWLLATAVAPTWAIEAGSTTFGEGPGKEPVKAEWAVAIHGAFDYRCDFSGTGKKALVIYQLIDKAWKAISTCHTAGGTTTFGRMPGAADTRLAVTGWYGEGAAWRQCDLNGWKKNADGSYLSCAAPDGGRLMFTCAQSKCRKP